MFRAFNSKIQTDKYAIDDRAFYPIRRNIRLTVESRDEVNTNEIKPHLDSLNNVQIRNSLDYS